MKALLRWLCVHDYNRIDLAAFLYVANKCIVSSWWWLLALLPAFFLTSMIEALVNRYAGDRRD